MIFLALGIAAFGGGLVAVLFTRSAMDGMFGATVQHAVGDFMDVETRQEGDE